MAGNGNSGKNPTFHLSEKELETKIEQYKLDLENGLFARASWPHFVSYIGCLENELEEFIKKYSEDTKSAYYTRARTLRGVLQFMRGQIFSAKEWTGQQAQLARSHISRDYGDGIAYKDKDSNSGDVKFTVIFGSGDERAKEAAK